MRAIGREYLLRAFRVVEVFETRGQFEPYVTDRSGRAGVHIDVKNMNRAEQWPSDCALVRQPLGGIAGGEPHPLGRSVIFENDRTPPVDHLLFDEDRTGCRSMDCDLLRGEVVFIAHFVRQFEHPRKHRRHKLAVRDPVRLDQPEELFRIEPFHDDRRAAHADR